MRWSSCEEEASVPPRAAGRRRRRLRHRAAAGAQADHGPGTGEDRHPHAHPHGADLRRPLPIPVGALAHAVRVNVAVEDTQEEAHLPERVAVARGVGRPREEEQRPLRPEDHFGRTHHPYRHRAQTKYGPVQVRITLTGSKITNATAVQYPDETARSKDINSTAVPKLNQETLAAQSAAIDTVSGATYTSAGYKQSLQSALDQAGV